jgi:two-component system cell cycle sensor histidine kinase/response regulator CckA
MLRGFCTLVSVLLVVVSPLPALTVTLDDNYPPYSFRDANGQPQGILIDLWRLWSAKTGEPVVLVPQTWSQALATMVAGQADVIDTVFATAEREKLWDFSLPTVTICSGVFYQDGLVGISDLKNLQGYVVGIKRGDAAADVLTRAGLHNFVEYPNYEALIDAASRGSLHVFAMDVPPAQYLLIAKGLTGKFRLGFEFNDDAFRWAVAKGRSDLFDQVNRGFSRITPAERTAIEDHWASGFHGRPANARAVVVLVVAGLCVVGLLVIVVLLLRKQVRNRTGQLVGTEARLRISEERARAMVEALPDLLFVLEKDGTVVECRSPSSTDLYKNPGRFVGQRLSETFAADVASTIVEKLNQVSQEGGVGFLEQDLEIEGRRRAFDARVVAMSNGQLLAIVRDVSAINEAWRDSLQRNKLESLGVLAAGLAHDFNNNLAVIQGFVSLARVQLNSPEKALASLDKAVLASRRAAGLTGQLRVLAKGSPVDRQVLSVRDLAEEAASFALVGSPCVLAIEATDGPWTVEGDPTQLSQVFHNLVLNAVQAMPHGGTVTLVFRRSPDGRTTVSVVDQGAGIAPENLSKIFDPYFTTKDTGSGLGLSVVHAVVDRHGGTVAVESRPGVGSVFTVTLWGCKGQPADQVVRGPDPSSVRGHRVLIMEDETDLRELMVHVASSLAMEPTACRSGAEAVAAFDHALASGRPFTLVVSDLLVPGGMGGREMIGQLRSRPTEFKALAVTGFSAERSSEDFHNQGFNVILGKPFTVDELKSRIVEVMNTPWKTPWKPDTNPEPNSSKNS